MIDFGCPRCATKQRVADSSAGQKVACTKCGQRLKVPDPPEMRTMQAVLVPPKSVAAAAGSGNQWYYQEGENQRGPVAWAELKRMAAEGEPSPEGLIWGDRTASRTVGPAVPPLF